MSTSRPLELLHMDLFGPTSYKSIGGNSYCLVIVDDYSRYSWTFFLQEKSKTMSTFKKFAKRAQNLFGYTIVKIRSDNGSEFKNSHLHSSAKWCCRKEEQNTHYSCKIHA